MRMAAFVDGEGGLSKAVDLGPLVGAQGVQDETKGAISAGMS
jgi:hypothetical protein